MPGKTSHVVVGASAGQHNIQILHRYIYGEFRTRMDISFLFPITFRPPMLRSRLAENVLLSSSMFYLMLVLIRATK